MSGQTLLCEYPKQNVACDKCKQEISTLEPCIAPALEGKQITKHKYARKWHHLECFPTRTLHEASSKNNIYYNLADVKQIQIEKQIQRLCKRSSGQDESTSYSKTSSDVNGSNLLIHNAGPSLDSNQQGTSSNGFKSPNTEIKRLKTPTNVILLRDVPAKTSKLAKELPFLLMNQQGTSSNSSKLPNTEMKVENVTAKISKLAKRTPSFSAELPVEKNIETSILTRKILENNDFLPEKEEQSIRVSRVFTSSKGLVIAEICVSLNNYLAIIVNHQYLRIIGDADIKLRNLDLVQCFNCQRYGHMNSECYELRCVNCSQRHNHRCDASSKCANCCEENARQGTAKLATNHGANAEICPIRVKMQRAAWESARLNSPAQRTIRFDQQGADQL